MKHTSGNVLESEIEISVGWNIIHSTAGKLIVFEWKAENIVYLSGTSHPKTLRSIKHLIN